MHLNTDAGRPQRLQRMQHLGQGCNIAHDRIGIKSRLWRHQTLLPDQLQHPIHAECPAHGRCRLTAQLFHQIIIAAARTNRSLRSEPVGGEFEYREVVVVHTPNQSRIDGIGNAIGIEDGFQGIEVCQRAFAQIIQRPRCRLKHRLHGRILAVKNAQRVAVQAAPGVFIKSLRVAFKMGNQC